MEIAIVEKSVTDLSDKKLVTFKLVNEIDTMNKEIHTYERLIAENKRLIKKKRLELYDNCQHEWIYDEWANWDDRCKYICKHCNCYRNRNWN